MNIYKRREQYELAFDIANDFLIQSEKFEGIDFQVSALIEMGAMSEQTAEYSNALKSYISALSIAEKYKNYHNYIELRPVG